MTPDEYAHPMRVVHYVKEDAAAIYLSEIEDGGVAETEYVAGKGIDLDFDHDGRLVAIGVDGGASRWLPPEVLASAEQV
jgi:uncharacterized protein YuzE